MRIAQTRTLFGGSKLVATTVALASAAALTVGLVASVFAASTVTVMPADTQGWMNGDVRPGGSVEFTDEYGAPAGYGDGSLQLTTTDGVAKAQYAKILDEPVLLGEVDDIAYSTYRSTETTGSDVQAPAVNLVVDFNGDDEGGFATLVFEPVYNTDQGAITTGEWQDWVGDDASTWWSTKVMPGVPEAFDSFVTLETIKNANPDAVVQAIILNQGTGNPGLVSGVDAFTFNGTSYDFELMVADTEAPDVTITSPTDGATVQGDATLAATVSDDNQLLRYYYFVKGSDGQYVVGPTKVSTDEAVVNFSEVVDTTEWADGEYVFQMEARDAATNKDAGSTARVSFTVNNVVDAKDDCKQGGWEVFLRADGSSFKNQGQCVAYMVSSEKSKHHRD